MSFFYEISFILIGIFFSLISPQQAMEDETALLTENSITRNYQQELGVVNKQLESIGKNITSINTHIYSFMEQNNIRRYEQNLKEGSKGKIFEKDDQHNLREVSETDIVLQLVVKHLDNLYKMQSEFFSRFNELQKKKEELLTVEMEKENSLKIKNSSSSEEKWAYGFGLAFQQYSELGYWIGFNGKKVYSDPSY